jgi:hypothetical protein
VSADGGVVAFATLATNLSDMPPTGCFNAFIRALS